MTNYCAKCYNKAESDDCRGHVACEAISRAMAKGTSFSPAQHDQIQRWVSRHGITHQDHMMVGAYGDAVSIVYGSIRTLRATLCGPGQGDDLIGDAALNASGDMADVREASLLCF